VVAVFFAVRSVSVHDHPRDHACLLCLWTLGAPRPERLPTPRGSDGVIHRVNPSAGSSFCGMSPSGLSGPNREHPQNDSCDPFGSMIAA
jgi:hypothetical protein